MDERINRRAVLAGTAGLLAAGAATPAAATLPARYGLIGRMRAKPGQREALARILLTATEMPGCLSYIVANDAQDADALWITEVWDSAASHKASLALPAVRAAIGHARPLIAGFDSQVETVPLGGVGLG